MTAATGARPGSSWVLRGVAAALGAVIVAPVLLSSQDLYAWAASGRGLALPGWWPVLVPVALDLAAAACIGMTVVAAWRRDRPGVFGLLVWVFAAVSAYAQYTHGVAERDAGRAQDAWWAMPAFALLGPLLLEATLHRLRRWARQDTAELLSGAAGFGARWLVAPASTLAAWAASRREGIATAAAALAFVTARRTVRALARQDPAEAVLYAFGATASLDPHAARVWLAARGVRVGQAALDTAATRAGRALPAGGASAAPVDRAGVPAAPARTSKRQPSTAERVAAAAARTPNATNAALAARLSISEDTVRRHRGSPAGSLPAEAGRDARPAQGHPASAHTPNNVDLAPV